MGLAEIGGSIAALLVVGAAAVYAVSSIWVSLKYFIKIWRGL